MTGEVSSGSAESTNPEIGHYKYLNTAPGDVRTVSEFALPKGYSLEWMKLRKFGRRSRRFVVNSVVAKIPAH